MKQDEKGVIIDEVHQIMEKSSIIIATHYRGLTVAQMGDLRKRMHDNGCQFRVVKNTLAKRASSGTPFESLSGLLSGPTGLAFSVDPVAPAKVLTGFVKDNPTLEIRGAVMNGQLLDGTSIAKLATMPSREVLLAKLLGTMNGPIQNFVGVLAAVPASLVRVLDQIRQSKEATA
ncbi:MAG: 50S ribosomal protein L10 [Magnetococcales bacterium]|nr:50S ribosomal protein L10 [Magnetococcales bacterium]MBF0419185.1 50S ribosomal protein L10 [Magnetococcales bacterium]